ncbi:hypothetical protein EK904_006239 [Melospiza melodia maxima]|nr:hypothetical protein EK904_006239 [Melospiza melodia maxima]
MVEKKLKARVQELVSALERLTKSSEIRHQQSAEFVNDLKRANSNLVAAYEKAKKKHQNKLKKLESQMMAMVERHETQLNVIKRVRKKALYVYAYKNFLFRNLRSYTPLNLNNLMEIFDRQLLSATS